MKLTLDTLPLYCRRLAGCLIWQQGTKRQGYPQARIDGVTWIVARYVWQLLGHDRPPPTHAIVPRCGRMLCVDPKCLHLVPRGDILRRDYARGRRQPTYQTPAQQQAHMVRMGWAKLDAAAAARVRESRHVPAAALAAELGVQRKAIWDIWAGRSWRVGA